MFVAKLIIFRKVSSVVRNFGEFGRANLLLWAVQVGAEYIVNHTTVPVIGCGAGRACHGHVAVLQDVLGMTERQPSFV
ncbi:MAG: 3-methyl-2-oxobutanoate hydroxymethyltransferase, partial [Kamptonema sp. SIO4C4]|nr:3-methyl-2-oxobutanoate hydroxymethyltransferase [Kamptonema sp. SIO4C4]